MSAKEQGSGCGCYVYAASVVVCIVVIATIELICPEVIPFKFFEFWKTRGTLAEIIKASWPLLTLGGGINVLFLISKPRRKAIENRAPGWDLLAGLGTSLWTGIIAEVVFRWILYFAQIAAYKSLNFVLLGFVGSGLLKWFFLHISGPVANFLTVGVMEPYLMGMGWAVGSAMLSSNGKFRNKRGFPGMLGRVDSWISGMFFFYLMFRFGLPAAMLIHGAYNIYTFTLIRIGTSVVSTFGWARATK